MSNDKQRKPFAEINVKHIDSKARVEDENNLKRKNQNYMNTSSHYTENVPIQKKKKLPLSSVVAAAPRRRLWFPPSMERKRFTLQVREWSNTKEEWQKTPDRYHLLPLWKILQRKHRTHSKCSRHMTKFVKPPSPKGIWKLTFSSSDDSNWHQKM